MFQRVSHPPAASSNHVIQHPCTMEQIHTNRVVTSRPPKRNPPKHRQQESPERKKAKKGGSICISSPRFYFERFYLAIPSSFEIPTPPSTSVGDASIARSPHRLWQEKHASIPVDISGSAFRGRNFVLKNALVSRSAHTPPRLSASTTPIILAHRGTPRVMTPEPADEHHTAWWPDALLADWDNISQRGVRSSH